MRPAKDHIPGETANAYFKAYARRFGIDGLIQFNTKVIVAEHQEDTAEGGWVLTIEKTEELNTPSKVFARRLVVATGLTTDPILPTFDGQDTFGAPIFHAKDFSQYADTLKTAKSATVYGVGKYAWDVAYSYAAAGVPVNWVIRGEHSLILPIDVSFALTRYVIASGHGLGWVTTPRVSPFKLWLEKLARKLSLP